MRQVYAEMHASFAVGEDGELFSWGLCTSQALGHGDEEDQPSPKRVEARRGVRVSRASRLGNAMRMRSRWRRRGWCTRGE